MTMSTIREPERVTVTVSQGVPGPPGPAGPAGDPGPQGIPGVGVPTGGATNQVLAKTSAADYATGWVNQTGGGLTLPLTQHLTFSPNNTYDIGDAAAANRPRSIYVGTSVVTPVLYGPSNVVEMRNGTTAQTQRIYYTYTDASNYSRLIFAAGSTPLIMTEQAGTGPALQLLIGTRGGTPIDFYTNNIGRWQISANGVLWPLVDNAHDIGQPASGRVKNIYQAGGTFQSYNPGAGIANDGTNYERVLAGWVSNVFYIRPQNGGTGVARQMQVVHAIKAGAPVDADYNTPADGMLTIDTTNNRIYVRSGGAWRYAALT